MSGVGLGFTGGPAYVIVAVGVVLLLVALGWLFMSERDPLVYLVPIALAFPPLIAYGGKALGWPGGWLSTRVALVGCIAIGVVFRLIRRDFSYRAIPAMRFVAPYLILVLMSVLWVILGPYNGESGAIASELLSWMLPVGIFFLLAGSSQGEANLRQASVVLASVVLAIAIYSALQALVLTGNDQLVPTPIAQLTQYGRSDLWFGAFRIYGTLPNLGPNFLGAFLLFPTVLAFSLAVDNRGMVRIAWLAAALAGVAVIVGTYSRGTMLGLVVSLIVLPLWRRSGRGVAAAVVGIALGVVLLAGTSLGRYAGSLYSSGQLDVSGSSRLLLWQAILNTTPQHPLGFGFNGWLRASRGSMDVGLLDPPASIGMPHPAENQWMRELADRGPLGVLALGLLLVGLIGATYRAANRMRSQGHSRGFLAASGAAYIGWSCVFLTGDHLMYDSIAGMFWYMTALALAATRDAKVPRPEETTLATASRSSS